MHPTNFAGEASKKTDENALQMLLMGPVMTARFQQLAREDLIAAVNHLWNYCDQEFGPVEQSTKH